MRRICLAFLLAGAGLLAAPRAVVAGAWTQPAGHLYAKLSGLRYHSDEVYNDMGDLQEMGTNDDSFRARQLFLYAEYGLLERLTLVTQVNGGVLTDEDGFVRQQTTGLGDLELGLKYRLAATPAVLSPMLSVKLPTGYHAGYEPALGTGEPDVEGRLLLSKSLHPLPLYASVDGAWRWRGGPFSNQWSWGAEVGATPHPRLFAKVLVGGTHTMVSQDDADLGVVGASQQVSEGDFMKVGVNGAVQVHDGLWFDVLVESIVDGENIGAGWTWGLGLAVTR